MARWVLLLTKLQGEVCDLTPHLHLWRPFLQLSEMLLQLLVEQHKITSTPSIRIFRRQLQLMQLVLAVEQHKITLTPSTKVYHSVVSEMVDHASDEDDDRVLPRIGFDYNTSEGEEDDQPDALNRTRIRPIGNTFEDSRVVLGQAYSIVRSHYNGSWSCWSKIPAEEKDFWWREFEGRDVMFRAVTSGKTKIQLKSRQNWRFKCSQYLHSKFAEARPSPKRPMFKRPHFVSPEHWVDMKKEFQSDAFKSKSERNKRNRASEARDGTGIYTGGSKSVVQHVGDYEKEHGKPMTQEKLIKRTYKKKRWDMEWIQTTNSPRTQQRVI